MKMKQGFRVFFWIGICILINFYNVYAFEQKGVAKGNKEVAVYINWFSVNPDEGGSTDVTYLGGSFGYFFTDPLEVGITLQITDTDFSSPFRMGSFVKYHFFVTPTTTPYIGGSLAYNDPDVQGQDSSIGLNINVGANFFITENSAISPELNYDIYSDYNMTSLLIQLKIFF